MHCTSKDGGGRCHQAVHTTGIGLQLDILPPVREKAAGAPGTSHGVIFIGDDSDDGLSDTLRGYLDKDGVLTGSDDSCGRPQSKARIDDDGRSAARRKAFRQPRDFRKGIERIPVSEHVDLGASHRRRPPSELGAFARRLEVGRRAGGSAGSAESDSAVSGMD